MVVPGNIDTAYHSSPRENTEPGWWLSETAFLTTAVSPIMPETPFNIADSVSDPERSRVQTSCSWRALYGLCPLTGPSRGFGLPWSMAPTPTALPSPLTARKTWRTVEP